MRRRWIVPGSLAVAVTALAFFATTARAIEIEPPLPHPPTPRVWENPTTSLQLLGSGAPTGPFTGVRSWTFYTQGGSMVSLPNVVAGEEMHLLAMPGVVATADFRILISAKIGSNWYAIAMREGNQYTNYRFTSSYAEVRVYYGVKSASSGNARYVRLVRNDYLLANSDPDNDKLGSGVESQIGTCSVRGGIRMGFDCATIQDARDTDGDGISDAWEFLGRTDMTPIQTLPFWGANPRHKDLFLEVDFKRRTLAENTSSALDKMDRATAVDFAAVYNDAYTTDPAKAALHASQIRNPDGIPGIKLHMDTGSISPSSAYQTLYGAWGGYNAVNAVINPDTGQYEGQRAKDVWQTNMTAARRGIFRYALGYRGGGGKNGKGFTTEVQFASGEVSAHETGHMFGLGHSPLENGLVNCQPNYPSVMNYAYMSTLQFSDGSRGPSMNNTRLQEAGSFSSAPDLVGFLDSEFNYRVETGSGDVDWNRDWYQTPQTQLIEAMANSSQGHSCEATREGHRAIPNAQSTKSPAMLRANGLLYVLFIDLNGELKFVESASSWDCRDPNSFACQQSSFSAIKNIPTATGMGTPAGIQAGKYVDPATGKDVVELVIIDVAGYLWRSSGRSDGNPPTIQFSTPTRIFASQPTLVSGEPGFTLYDAPRKLHRNTEVPFAALWIGLLVVRDSDNMLRYSTVALENGNLVYVPLAVAKEVVFESTTNRTMSWRYFKTNPKMSPTTGLWPHTRAIGWNGTLQPQVFAASMPDTTTNVNSYEILDIHELTLENPGPGYTVTGPGAANDDYYLYKRYTGPNLVLNNREGAGRLNASWVPYSHGPISSGSGAGSTGHLSYYFSLRHLDEVGTPMIPYMWMTSVNPGADLYEDKFHYFDNIWMHSYGLAFHHTPNVDTNLRAVWVNGIPDSKDYRGLIFKPVADGLVDRTYRDQNDWTIIADDLCKGVVNPGGLVSTPISCVNLIPASMTPPSGEFDDSRAWTVYDGPVE